MKCLLNPTLPPSVVIPSEAEGSAFCGHKKQIPPLRCAPVGMTGFGGVASASTCGHNQQIEVDAMSFAAQNLFRTVVREGGNPSCANSGSAEKIRIPPVDGDTIRRAGMRSFVFSEFPPLVPTGIDRLLKAKVRKKTRRP
jgi:hypothetical protein